MPSAFASTMTVTRIDSAGAMVKRMLDTIVFFIFSPERPSCLPLFHALTMKKID